MAYVTIPRSICDVKSVLVLLYPVTVSIPKNVVFLGSSPNRNVAKSKVGIYIHSPTVYNQARLNEALVKRMAPEIHI